MGTETDPDAEVETASAFASPLLLTALALTGAVAVWGILDTKGLASMSYAIVTQLFSSRAWFIMLTVSGMLLLCAWLAVSRYGDVVLGADDDTPEFSTISWLTMLFAAGMGVGLLYFGSAEPLSHYVALQQADTPLEPASGALFLTNFHWGLHAWAIYALTGLIIAYFTFRLGCRSLVSAPFVKVYGSTPLTRGLGWTADLLAIFAIAIGVGGSLAMGIFQIEEGVRALFGIEGPSALLTYGLFAVMCACYVPPLMVDLGRGMALLSNIAMGIAVGLLVFIILAGPTALLMGGVVEAIGEYAGRVLVHGFRTFSYLDEDVNNWFRDWTLTYMVWWLAWAPFVGVFIARISKGRTIREFVAGVVLVPTLFSIVWFGVFGGVGFYAALRTEMPVVEVVETDLNKVAIFVLEHLPLPTLTIAAVVVAAFLFLITSVVSAAFVLGMFSTNGGLNPSPRIKLAWGALLGALGLVMILADSIDAVRQIIALGALPFVFVVLVLVVCLLRALGQEEIDQ